MLSETDCGKFLIVAYFGRSVWSNPLDACIRRAYRDLSRTLRGIGKCPSEMKEAANERLKLSLEELASKRAPIDQVTFEEWHKETTQQLKDVYHCCNYDGFKVGHAQKWINMAFKYILTLERLGEMHPQSFERWYEYCHVPLDNVINEKLKAVNKSFGFDGAWSKQDSYTKYKELQKDIREKVCIDCAPLYWEYENWMWDD